MDEPIMATRYFALVGGIVYALVGIIGFFPAALLPPPPGAPELTVDTLYGYLLGLFPVNVLHSLVHLAPGPRRDTRWRDTRARLAQPGRTRHPMKNA
jgi:hypothetical protein